MTFFLTLVLTCSEKLPTLKNEEQYYRRKEGVNAGNEI